MKKIILILLAIALVFAMPFGMATAHAEENGGGTEAQSEQESVIESESAEEFKQAAKDYEDNSNRVTLGEMVDKFLKWCGKIIKKGCDNYFEVYKDGKIVINAPVQEDEVSYSVQDEGVGMAESEIVHVFERFYRSDSARNSKTGGTGLGLSIAKWIVDAHGGVIEILSKPDMGTRFTVKFSIKKQQKC